VRPHARGGLGEVFVALDQELHREVALKEIQNQYADEPESRRRFLLEAEVTGGLEHPGIVPVYSLGQYADGRPFYAMRFIKGDSLKDAIERFHKADIPGRDPGERSLELRKLLGRFLDVCNAIAYAHSRGVLHRDLKPGNIMLGAYGETLVVDWGLAKPVGRPDGSPAPDERTLRPPSASGSTLTRMGSALGTPAFMSPEQADGRLDELGPASDVYSLGATLYCLLTGVPPFHEPILGLLLHQVKNGEFQRPRQVKASVPPALEAICLKAMALKAADRYTSSRALAEDIEHWLADEPVSAWREPWDVRSRRWLKRHRPLVAGAAAPLLAAVPLSLVIAVNREQARQQAETDKREIARQKDIAQANEKAATEREAETKAVLDFVENRVFAAALPAGFNGGLGEAVTLRRAIEAALPYVAKSFTNQPLIEARLRQMLADAFGDLSDEKTKVEQAEAARALYARHRGHDHPDTLRSMNTLANSYWALGRYTEALKLHEETLALRKAKLGPDHPDTLNSMHNLANTYGALGRHADALKLQEETLALRKVKLGPDHSSTLAIMDNLAISYANLGRHAEALKLFEENLALTKAKLGPDHPATLRSMNTLASSYSDLGRNTDALKLHEETLALQKAKLGHDHPDTLASMNNLAMCYSRLGRHADALKLHEETLALMKAKLGPDHPNTLASMNNLAMCYSRLGRHADALKLFEEMLALQKVMLGHDHPDTLRSMYNLAECYRILGRYADAIKLYEETVALRKAKLGPDHPATLWNMYNLANTYGALGRHADALKLCRQTAPLWEKLNRADANSLYTAACMRAVTAAVLRAADSSPAGAKQAEAEAEQAMAWLKKAVAAGWKNAAHMEKDKDLDALRDREDFKKLLAELKAGPAAGVDPALHGPAEKNK
jgi:serine/threonine protein kinase/tetratricopeptide (TPR) repeat protein